MAPNQLKNADVFGNNPKQQQVEITSPSSEQHDSKAKELTFLGIPILTIVTSSFAAVFAPAWKMFCAIRWVLASPVKMRFLPKCFPGFKGVPGFKHIAHVTYGEVRS